MIPKDIYEHFINLSDNELDTLISERAKRLNEEFDRKQAEQLVKLDWILNKEHWSADEFAKDMQYLAINWNEELFHIYADLIMCKLLSSLGYESAVTIFENTPKWYS